MKIELKAISVKELTAGYADNAERGVFGYGGLLDIRPPFQREFVYKDKQRDAVIDTVNKNFPLNVMYWAVRGDGKFEIIDGQQRTISICEYVECNFSVDKLKFDNLPDDKQKKILDYQLMVYFCTGAPSEKLEWFKTINIAGEELTAQELRNAVYAGRWVTDAKSYFSRTGCAAYGLGGQYLAGAAIRQEYLETVVKWLSGGDIEGYMGENQHKENADELWAYFQKVVEWTESVFPTYYKEMKGLPWGEWYNAHKGEEFDGKKMDAEVAKLMENEDVTNKKGIFPYLLTGAEKHLNIRAFSPRQKREAFQRQKGICATCEKPFPIEKMEADHITPWREGGETVAANCQVLCRECNRRKGGK